MTYEPDLFKILFGALLLIGAILYIVFNYRIERKLNKSLMSEETRKEFGIKKTRFVHNEIEIL